MKNTLSLTLIASTLLLAACGGGGGGSSSNNPQFQQAEELLAEGKYRAYLRPMNTHVYGFITSGMAEVEVKGNDFSVNIIMDDAPGVVHAQALHAGAECADATGDANGDGFVDVTEASAVSGGIQFRLDQDIAAPTEGSVYPSGRAYTYRQSADVDDMKRNLDQVTGRVVMIYGAPSGAPLPGSVASLDGKSAQASLPIACGILKLQ